MLGYRHAYHAGNFADLLKHALWLDIIKAMQQKPAPICIIETHAAAGHYDLTSSAAERGEHLAGIGQIWQQSAPAALHDYLQLVRDLNPDGELRHYPGSPLIAAHRQREGDRLILHELHPADYAQLRHHLGRRRRTSLLQQDGYAGLKATLPPSERRAAILIDPAYERSDEYTRVIDALTLIRQRFPAAVVALWYPLTSHSMAHRLYHALAASGNSRYLKIEMVDPPARTSRSSEWEWYHPD
jgi:23S rRNA (adenine2030-N6)-methyltransferase